MSNHKTFVERVLRGEVFDLAAIDDEIDTWHDTQPNCSLADWLGMSHDEYALFVEKPEFLRTILMARMHGIDLNKLVMATNNSNMALAARGASAAEFEAIRQWLQQTGRL